MSQVEEWKIRRVNSLSESIQGVSDGDLKQKKHKARDPCAQAAPVPCSQRSGDSAACEGCVSSMDSVATSLALATII